MYDNAEYKTFKSKIVLSSLHCLILRVLGLHKYSVERRLRLTRPTLRWATLSSPAVERGA
jgi:hypothetical protein